jgi:hypothetical protein
MKKEKDENQELQDQFVILRASGETFKGIATKLNIPVADLIEWSCQLKEEIGNMKAVLFEEKESATFTKRSRRVEVLQTIADRMKDEIATRDLSDVPTDKLLTLFTKMTEHLKGDEQQVRFEKTRTVHYEPLETMSLDSTRKDEWSV